MLTYTDLYPDVNINMYIPDIINFLRNIPEVNINTNVPKVNFN